MGLGNTSKVILHYLLIKEMTCLGHQDEFSIMSSLMYMITYYIGLTVSHEIGYWIVITLPSDYAT